jgi:septum formation protein
MKLEIILASRSAARAAVLKQVGIIFKIVSSNVDEKKRITDPKAYVLHLSSQKAETVGTKIQSETKKHIVIGCDTIVLDPYQRILGKPKSRKEAYTMLQTLSGNSHRVLTGCSIYIYPEKSKYQTLVSTLVKFRDLSNEEILYYLSTNDWQGRAGSYAIQGLGALLIEELKGDYYNVVGLPITWIWQTLWNHFGKNLLGITKKD